MTQEEDQELGPVSEKDIHISDLDDLDTENALIASVILAKVLRDTLKKWDHATFAKDQEGYIRWIAPPHSFLDPEALLGSLEGKEVRWVRRVLTDGKQRFAMKRNGELWQVEIDDVEEASSGEDD